LASSSQSNRVTSRDYAHPTRPAPVKLAIGACAVLRTLGARPSYDVEGLLASARRSTGLSDFGDDAFLEPLERLAHGIEHEAGLHPLGAWIARANLVRTLGNRLRIVNEWFSQPAMLAQPVKAPVIIVGLQRTGTTLIQRLLSLIPGLRSLPSWEAVAPARPTGWAPTKTDPRIRAARMTTGTLGYVAPDFFAVHPIDPDAQEEDVLLFDVSFWSTSFEAIMRLPSFSAWLESIDHTPAYREYAKVMQMLLWRKPGRWIGKTPHHLEHLDTLLEVFPDAKVIHTHRDPVRVIGSFCSMVCHGRGGFSNAIDPREVGQQWGNKQVRMLEAALDARETLPAESFVDVRYRDLVDDPIAQAKRVASFLGVEIDDATERRMTEFLGVHTQHRYGRHDYAFEDFGLERKELDERFARYKERFEIGDD
jgi:hypothetical protein